MIFGKPRNMDDSIHAKLAEALRDKEKAILERDEAREALARVEPIRCSFCGKTQWEVRKVIAGPTVFICDECVTLCVDIIKETPERPASATESATQREVEKK